MSIQVERDCAPVMTITGSEGTDGDHYYDLPNPEAYSNPENDEIFCEDTPLLGNNRSRSKKSLPVQSPIVYRSRSPSVASSRREAKSSKLSVWRLSRFQKIILATTSAVDLLTFLSISIMAPFFPEEALQKDVSDTLSGWIFGTSPFIQFLASPVIGKLMPHVGVKFMFIAGMFIFSSCTILFGMLAYVPSDNGNGVFIALAFLLQIVRSVGITSASTASFVLLIQAFPDNISSAFGFGEVFVGLGLVAGPAVGGVLYGLGGFYLPFVSIGGLAMLCIPLMAWFVPAADPGEAVSKNPGIPITKIFCTPNGILTTLTITASTFSWSILDPTLEPHLRKFELRPELIGVIFLVMASVYAVTAPLWGWVSDKMTDQRPLLVFGFLFACLGSLLVGPSPLLGFSTDFDQLWLVVVALVVLGASASLSSVPTFDMFFTFAENAGCENNTATYSMISGFWMSMYSLGDFLGPSAGGVLLDSVGFKLMCTFTAGLCLFMVALLTISWVCDSECMKNCHSRKQELRIETVYDSFQTNNCYNSSIVD